MTRRILAKDGDPPLCMYDVNNEPIIKTKSLMELFLKSKKYKGESLNWLYDFYYYTAKWQKTNTPKATTSYVAKGLGWTEEKVQKNKKGLKELGLIEDIQSVDERGKIKGHYVYVKFIWGQETAARLFDPRLSKQHEDPCHTRTDSTPPNFQGVESWGTNALSAGNGNALSAGNVSTNVETERETRKGTKANTPLREQERLPNQETLPESTEHLPAPRIIQRIQISSPAQANVPVAEPVEQSPVTKLKANLPATKQTSPVPENNLPADMPEMRGSPSDLKEDSAPPKQNRSIASLAREIALFWISAGLRSFKDEKAKKRAISKLERVLRGTLFNDQPGYEKFYGKKFTVEEVIQAIKNFKIAATDPKYRPGLLATKKKMMQIGLCEWLLNEFCKKNGVATSSFITNLEPPKPVSSPKYEPATEDLYPEITSTLKRVFCQSICQSDNPLVPWDVKDENNFRKTSNFLYDFYEKNKSRVSRVYQGMGPEKMAKLLIQCISSSTDAERFRITTGWLCSSKTLNTRFPQYLVDENIFTNMKPVTENAQFMSRSMRDRIDYKRLGVMVDGNGHY